MNWRRVFGIVLTSCLLILTGCGKDTEVLSNLDERDANLIVVFLESKGIAARKVASTTGPAVGAENTGPKFSIYVDQRQSINAMAVLNQNGLPQRSGTDLLSIFAKSGLMSSDREETIRYQAGLASQITNMILMIDGVIDASLQLSFPPTELTPGEEAIAKKITAAAYVKHQGVIDDPNNHLESKIKRIVSGSVTGLDINDVTVVSDWSRFTDVKPEQDVALLAAASPQDYISIWSIILSKGSVGRFRAIFFGLLSFTILLTLVLGWMIWKFYHILKQKGLRELLKPAPIAIHKALEPENEE